MSKIIGIYKELPDNEEILSETPDYVSVEGGSYAFGTDEFYARLFLTNRRLLFLIATQADLNKMNPEAVKGSGFFGKMAAAYEMARRGDPKKSSKIMVNTWMEIPLQMIRKLETPSSILGSTKRQLVIEFDTENKSGLLGLFRKNPKVVVHLDNRDIWKTTIMGAMKEKKIETMKATEGTGYDELGKRVCSICGTHYDVDKVKMIQCPECKRMVCREKLIGKISKEWIKTGCFDDKKFLCNACLAKVKEKEEVEEEEKPVKKARKTKGKVCPNCGSKVKGKFCGNCGGEL